MNNWTQQLKPGSDERAGKVLRLQGIPAAPNTTASLDAYFISLWIFIAYLSGTGLPRLIGPTFVDTTHSLLLVLSYSFIYLLPLLLLNRLLRPWYGVRVTTIALLSCGIIAFLFADSRLFGLYGFHFNGFVWNLLTTKGGFASLGADQISVFTTAKYTILLAAIIAGSLLLNRQFHALALRWKWIFWLFLFTTLSERIIYGIAYAEVYGPILTQADHMLLYQPLRINSFLKSIGHEVVPRTAGVGQELTYQGNIQYPLSEIAITPVEKPYNIIFLVAESLRDDGIFTEQVMPNSLKFAAEHGTNFRQHVSGGNGTRQALFSLFYGLYGNYWDQFLRERKSPVLFDVLNEYDYQYFLFTSSYFTYPEFDKTIFGSVPPETLVETNDGEAWTRDERNVEKLLGKISRRDRNKPFLGFIFFEGTHARYSFPADSAIRQDYTPSVDYAELKADELLPKMDGMFARYQNAAHYVDQEFGQVYEYLKNNELLDNTIVIVTGDHGEEFMENDRWGHNSSFSEQQIRVPMIVSHPDFAPAVIQSRTSHMDIPAMLLQTLGVTAPLEDYSLGQNIMQPSREALTVVASWTDLGIVSEKGKLVIPFKSTTQHRHLATSLDDKPIVLDQLTEALSTEILQVITNSRRFVFSDKSLQ